MGIITKNLIEMSNLKINDQVIAISTDFAMKSAAQAYLSATLMATTPEVRRFINDLLTQKLAAHQSLTELIVKKNWVHPYANLSEQLTIASEQSNWVMNTEDDENHE